MCLVLCHKHSGQRQVPLLLWALPGPTPGSMWQRWPCRASGVTHICQTSPPTAPIAPDELHLSKTPLLCLADFHGGARGTCTRITETWIFHTFSLKIIMLAFTDLGPGLSFVFPCPCSQSTQSVVKSQLTASVPLNLQAGQGHLFFAGPASPHSSVSPSL